MVIVILIVIGIIYVMFQRIRIFQCFRIFIVNNIFVVMIAYHYQAGH